MYPPSVECYAVQAFTIASNFDPKRMPKEQNQVTTRKVSIVTQFLLSRRPNHHSNNQHIKLIGSRETQHASHLETDAKRCLRRNQCRAARSAWFRCGLSTPRRDSKTDELSRSSIKRAKPFLLIHNQACLPGSVCNLSRKGATRSVQAAWWARTQLFKKPEYGTQFQCERTSSIDQPTQSTRGSEAEHTTSFQYSSFRDRKSSLDPERLRRALRHSQTNFTRQKHSPSKTKPR